MGAVGQPGASSLIRLDGSPVGCGGTAVSISPRETLATRWTGGPNLLIGSVKPGGGRRGGVGADRQPGASSLLRLRLALLTAEVEEILGVGADRQPQSLPPPFRRGGVCRGLLW